MAKKTKKSKEDWRGGAGGLFIPGGLLFGMGVGFLIDNVPAGMFMGLGLGFVAFAITVLVKKR